MKYVSIDVETTGLDPAKSDVLEIGCILDELSVPLQEYPTVKDFQYLRIVIYREQYKTDAYCASLHKELWDEIKKLDTTRLKEEGQFTRLCGHVETEYTTPEGAIDILLDWLESNGISERITSAGKNFGAFDLQHLKKLCLDGQTLPFKHRALDPGQLYYEKGDTELPNLSKCLERAEMKPSALHTALGDAFDVVRLIRYKLG